MNNGKQVAYKYLLSKRPSGVYEITTELVQEDSKKLNK